MENALMRQGESRHGTVARAYRRLVLRDKSELTRDVPQQQPRVRCGKAPGQGSTRRQSVTRPGTVWSAGVTQKA
ncbi:hypothetical protein GCM10017776_59780 [Streptomyces griseoluteus]|nr:hypothetical protein GCM10017776_59780 [Streptomyces griseoluteus]